MRRGGHRDRLATPVETALAHGGVDRGEALREALVADGSGIEPHRATALRRHRARVGAGHDVARGELAIGVGVEREAAAGVVDEGRALSAHGFRHEERCAHGQRGRVELHELEVGDGGAARIAAAMPSPVAPSGLVVWA